MDQKFEPGKGIPCGVRGFHEPALRVQSISQQMAAEGIGVPLEPIVDVSPSTPGPILLEAIGGHVGHGTEGLREIPKNALDDWGFARVVLAGASDDCGGPLTFICSVYQGQCITPTPRHF